MTLKTHRISIKRQLGIVPATGKSHLKSSLIKTSLCLLSFLYLPAFSSGAFAEKKTKIAFEKTEYDFGEVYLGSGAVKHCFVFQNGGKEPLLIKDVRSSCGCVYGSWTKKPVAPGDTGSVCIIYKNNMSGTFRKTLKVISNAEKTPLTIKGNTIRK